MAVTASAARGAEKQQQDYLERARELRPMLTRRRRRDRAPPRGDAREIVAAMKERGIFRMLLPRSLGGAELDPLTYTAVLEDAGAGRRQHRVVPRAEFRLLDDRAVSAAGDRARSVRRAATASSPGGPDMPGAGARRRGRGRLSRDRPAGASPPAAGTRAGSAAISRCSRRTAPRAWRRTGGPQVRTMVFPKSEAKIIDNWQVLGLRGTGSDSYALEDYFVPQRLHRRPRQRGRTAREGAALPVHLAA